MNLPADTLYENWLSALLEPDETDAVDCAFDLLTWLDAGGSDPMNAQQSADFHYWCGAHQMGYGIPRTDAIVHEPFDPHVALYGNR